VFAACVAEIVTEPRATTLFGLVPGVPSEVITTPLIVDAAERVESLEQVESEITKVRVLLFSV
jgi:hypothetical protein